MKRRLVMPTEEEYRAHGEAPYGHVRATAFDALSIDEEAHAVEGYVSTDQWARDGQRILPQAWARNLPVYEANPIVTFCHSWWDIPIGLASNLQIDERGLRARLEFDVEDEMAARVFQAIVTKRLRTTSVAWDGEGLWESTPRIGDSNEFGEWVEKPDGNIGWEWRDNLTLMEIAVVPIPVDTGATFSLARSMGLAPPEMGTAREREDERVLDDLKRIANAGESIRNWNRHLERDGGAPSPAVIEQVLSPISYLVEIAAGYKREGRVLSAANRELVDEAVEALTALQAADDASREDRGGGAVGARAPSPAGVEGNGVGAGAYDGMDRDTLAATITEERRAAALDAIGVSYE